MMDIVERLMSRHCCQDNLDQEAAQEIERLRKRVELLQGYLSGALDVVEGFVHCDTKEARKALGEQE